LFLFSIQAAKQRETTAEKPSGPTQSSEKSIEDTEIIFGNPKDDH